MKARTRYIGPYNCEDTLMEMRYNASEPRTQVACPYCGSHDAELFSLFGQQLLTVQYYCNTCHTPFEHIKDDEVLNEYEARKEGQS